MGSSCGDTVTLSGLDDGAILSPDLTYHEEVLDFQLAELINFLKAYQSDDSNIHLVCPWDGVPLPFVELTLEPIRGLRAKMEFSLQSSEALIQYVLSVRMTTAKVSN